MAFKSLSLVASLITLVSVVTAGDNKWLSPEYKDIFKNPLPIPPIKKPITLVIYLLSPEISRLPKPQIIYQCINWRSNRLLWDRDQGIHTIRLLWKEECITHWVRWHLAWPDLHDGEGKRSCRKVHQQKRPKERHTSSRIVQQGSFRWMGRRHHFAWRIQGLLLPQHTERSNFVVSCKCFLVLKMSFPDFA